MGDHSLLKVFWVSDKADEWRVINEIETCLIDIGAWLKENRLKMNVQKVELMLLGSRQQLIKCHKIGSSVIDDKAGGNKSYQISGFKAAWEPELYEACDNEM